MFCGFRHGFDCLTVSGSLPPGGLFNFWGVVFWLFWRRLAMEDARWTLPLFMCCGCSDDLGQGCVGPPAADHSRLPLLRPVALYTLDMGMDL